MNPQIIDTPCHDAEMQEVIRLQTKASGSGTNEAMQQLAEQAKSATFEIQSATFEIQLLHELSTVPRHYFPSKPNKRQRRAMERRGATHY